MQTTFFFVLSLLTFSLCCEVFITDEAGTLNGNSPCTYYFQDTSGYTSFWATSFLVYSQDARYTFYDGPTVTSKVLKDLADKWENPITNGYTNLITSTGSVMTLKVIFQSGQNATWDWSMSYAVYRQVPSEMIGTGYDTTESTGEISQQIGNAANGISHLGSTWHLDPPCAYSQTDGVYTSINITEYNDPTQMMVIVLRKMIYDGTYYWTILTPSQRIYSSTDNAAATYVWDSSVTVQSMVLASGSTTQSFKIKYDFQPFDNDSSYTPPHQNNVWIIVVITISIVLAVVILVILYRRRQASKLNRFQELPTVVTPQPMYVYPHQQPAVFQYTQ